MGRPIKVLWASEDVRSDCGVGPTVAQPSIAIDSERITSWVRSAKKRSTRLSQDELVGVKCILKRGCRSSQAFTLGCLWVA